MQVSPTRDGATLMACRCAAILLFALSVGLLRQCSVCSQAPADAGLKVSVPRWSLSHPAPQRRQRRVSRLLLT